MNQERKAYNQETVLNCITMSVNVYLWYRDPVALITKLPYMVGRMACVIKNNQHVCIMDVQ